MYLYFLNYKNDERKHYVEVEFSHDGVTFEPFYGYLKKVPGVCLEIAPKKNLKAFRIHGYDTTNGEDGGYVHMTFMKILGIEHPMKVVEKIKEDVKIRRLMNFSISEAGTPIKNVDFIKYGPPDNKACVGTQKYFLFTFSTLVNISSITLHFYSDQRKFYFQIEVSKDGSKFENLFPSLKECITSFDEVVVDKRVKAFKVYGWESTYGEKAGNMYLTHVKVFGKSVSRLFNFVIENGFGEEIFHKLKDIVYADLPYIEESDLDSVKTIQEETIY